MLAEVIYTREGCALRVAGVVIAVEGDVCRELSMPADVRPEKVFRRLTWTEKMLLHVAESINLGVVQRKQAAGRPNPP